MIFAQPTPFAEAAASHEARALMPTSLGSAELAQLGQGVLRQAMFSARTDNARYLQLIKDTVAEMLAGKLDFATGRERLERFLDAADYVAPSEEEEGGITDLRSEKRINLVLQTNLQMAQGYGSWVQGQDQAILDHWPAQELYRQEDRREKRDWPTRWEAEGGSFFAGESDYPHKGRMIALKDSDIWEKISRFDQPWPPFDFNSGMGTRDITRKEAVALGLIDRKTRIAPQTRPFDEGAAASAAGLDEAVKEELAEEGITEDADGQLHPAPEEEEETPTPTPEPEPTPAPAADAPVPVSASLDFDPDAPNADLLQRTQDIIDGVHGDGALPRVRVDGVTSFDPALSERGLGGFNGEHLGVNPDASEETQMAAYIHEIGHDLDLYAFQHTSKGWGSETAPELEDWRYAVLGTKAYANLDDAYESQRFADPHSAETEFLDYSRTWPELFARSYAQYIAERAGNAALLAGMEQVAAGTDYFQWQAHDFAPVAAAFDALFAQKGWIKP